MIGFGDGPKTKFNIQIIGVVEDSLYEGPREGVRRQVFIPNWGRGSVTYYVRAHAGFVRSVQHDPRRSEAA